VNSATHHTYVAHFLTERKMRHHSNFQENNQHCTLNTKPLPSPESSKDVRRELGRRELGRIEVWANRMARCVTMEVNDLCHEPPMVMAQNDNHFAAGEVTI
jgi:hypothetical protein